MRRTTRLAVALTVVLAFTVSACNTAGGNAAIYKTVGSLELTVDLAMKTWGEYVRSGQAQPAQETTVKGAYAKYQTVLGASQTALHISQGSETPAELIAAAGALVAIIETFTNKKIALRTTGGELWAL